jgi:hypothetical protein
MKKKSVATAILLAIASTGAYAADTFYVFDNVTRFDLHRDRVTIVGILRNDTTATTLTMAESTSTDDNSTRVNRCVPLLLTMMEKPGRYYLNITADPAFGPSLRELTNCGLELRS